MADHNARNRSIYQRLAGIYDLAARLPPVARPRTRMFTLAGIRPGQRVLVVGVGTGQDLAYLPAGAAVTGIDLSPAMLARARARESGAELREMNAEHLTFPDRSFDVVVLSSVLQRGRRTDPGADRGCPGTRPARQHLDSGHVHRDTAQSGPPRSQPDADRGWRGQPPPVTARGPG